MSNRILLHKAKFNHWCCERLLSDLTEQCEICYQKLPISFTTIIDTLLHIYQHANKTLQKYFPKQKIVKLTTVDEWQTILEVMLQQSRNWDVLLAKHNLSISEVDELVTLFDHNLYHYGQIIAILQLQGLRTISLDPYIYR